MPRLILKNKAEVIKEYFWKVKRKLIVGSSKKANIYIPDVSVVQDVHCILTKENDKYFITDNETINGTFVNGKAIAKVELAYHDEIVIGQSSWSISFLPEQPEENEFYLVGIYGKFKGKIFFLKKNVKIGRTSKNPQGEENDIVLSGDDTVSKGHCRIQIEEGDIYITDIGSTCGTTVNGEKIQYFEKVKLKILDEICIGRTIFRLCNGTKILTSPPKNQKILFLKIIKLAKVLLSLGIFLVFFYIFGVGLKNYFYLKKPKDLQINPLLKYLYGNEEFTTSISTSQPLTLIPNLAIGKFNNDKINDILYLDKRNIIYAYDTKTGMVLWQPKEFKFSEKGGIKIEDLNNDKIDDIIFITEESMLFVLDGATGNEIFKTRLQGTAGNSVVACGDLNLDGKKDIVCCNEEGLVYLIYSVAYPSVNIKTITTEAPIYAPPIIVSSKKLTPTVVVCNYNGKVTLIDGKTQNTRVFNLVGLTKKPHFVSVSPAAGDVNGDGIPELIFVTTLPQYVTCVDVVTTRALWSYFVQPQPPQEIRSFTPAAVIDFDKDNKNEVIFVSPIGYVFCFAGITDFAGGELLWSIQLNTQKTSNYSVSATFANLIGNDAEEIIVADEDGFIYIIANEEGKATVVRKERIKEEKIISPLLIGDLTGDGTLSIIYANSTNIIRILNTNSKTLPGNILSKCYFYTPQNIYINQENIEEQKNKILIGIFGNLSLLCILGISVNIKKRKFKKRKVL